MLAKIMYTGIQKKNMRPTCPILTYRSHCFWLYIYMYVYDIYCYTKFYIDVSSRIINKYHRSLRFIAIWCPLAPLSTFPFYLIFMYISVSVCVCMCARIYEHTYVHVRNPLGLFWFLWIEKWLRNIAKAISIATTFITYRILCRTQGVFVEF